jgi:hypothetical protein
MDKVQNCDSYFTNSLRIVYKLLLYTKMGMAQNYHLRPRQTEPPPVRKYKHKLMHNQKPVLQIQLTITEAISSKDNQVIHMLNSWTSNVRT